MAMRRVALCAVLLPPVAGFGLGLIRDGGPHLRLHTDAGVADALAPADPATSDDLSGLEHSVAVFWAAALALYVAGVVAAACAVQNLSHGDKDVDDDDDSPPASVPRHREAALLRDVQLEALVAELERPGGSLTVWDMLGWGPGEGEAEALRGRPRRAMQELRGYYHRVWRVETKEKRYLAGTITIALMTWVMLGYRVMCLQYDLSVGCLRSIDWLSRFMELFVLFCVLFRAHLMLQVDRIAQDCLVTYWIILLFYLFYIPASSLPPLYRSCTEFVSQCSDTGDRRTQMAVLQMDCSLQGQTSVVKLLTAIVLLPWLIVELELMNAACALVLFIYVSWSVAYHYFVEDPAFTKFQSAMRALVLFGACAIAKLKKYFLQKQQLNGYICDQHRSRSSYSLFALLKDMLPGHVLRRVLQDEPVADNFSQVSILFVTVHDFQHFVDSKTSRELVDFLNVLFSRFDDICEQHEVTKIESVMDEYVCCVGVAPDDLADVDDEEERALERAHSKAVRRLMVAAWEMLELGQDLGLALKMGVHTGPIVAGVISKRLPRYRLFGDTINTAARMMQKGLPGRLQFGEETFKVLSPGVLTSERGLVAMKGKGEVMTYLLDGLSPEEQSWASLRVTSSSFLVGAEHRQSIRPLIQRLLQATEFYCCADAEPSTSRVQFLWAKQGKETPMTQTNTGTSVTSAARSVQEAEWEEFVKEVNVRETTAKGRRLFLSEKASFTEVDEEEYRMWYHYGTICKKLELRLVLQAAELTVLSAVEMAALLAIRDHTRAFRYWPVFVCCRCIAVLSLLALLLLVYSNKLWVCNNPVRSQAWILSCCCVVSLLVFASYNSLSLAGSAPGNTDHQAEIVDGHGQVQPSTAFLEVFASTQVLSLVFVLVYLQIMRAHAFTFYQSLCWIPVSLLIISLMELSGALHSGLYFTRGVELFFLANTLLNAFLAHAAEQNDRRWFKARQAMERTRDRTSNILDQLMPPLIVQELRGRGAKKAAETPSRRLPVGREIGTFNLSHEYERATVAQSDLCGFTAFASHREPAEVVAFLGELFGRFDEVADEIGIWKVETVGDAYIAGQADKPLTKTESPAAVVLFGLRMVNEVHSWAREHGLVEVVNCRVGVHHGACIGGIVGVSMQRYHLFGELMTGVEVLESTAPEGWVQVSGACREAVRAEMTDEGASDAAGARRLHFDLVEGYVLRTSKGEEHSFEEVGGPTYVVTQS